MRHRVLIWVVPTLAVALTGTIAALPGAASALTQPAARSDQSDAGTLPRPAAADLGGRDARAPISGVVPGLTGQAAQAAAGPAADRFREVTRHRLAQSTDTAAGTGNAPGPLAAPLHTDWGVDIPTSQARGLHATQSVVPGAGPTHGGDYVYAPTAIAPGNACLEMTTAYTPNGPKLWAWDWCGGRDNVGKIVSLDAGFLATYTTTVNGRPAYSLDEHQTDAATNAWTTYLYNYTTGAWDTFYTSSGTFDLARYTYGWDIFEIYTSVDPTSGSGYYCRDLAGRAFESSAAQTMVGGTWTAVTASNSRLSRPILPGSSFDCPSLGFNLVHANDHWIAQIGGPSPTGSSSPSTGSSSPASSAGPPSSLPPGGSCTASYRLTNSWQGGFQGEVTVTAGSTAVNGWSVQLTLPAGSSISQSWNGILGGNGPTYTVRNQSYNGSLAAGTSVTFGFLGSGTPGTPAVSCTSP